MKGKQLGAGRFLHTNGRTRKLVELGTLGARYARREGRKGLAIAKWLTAVGNHVMAARMYDQLGLRGKALAVGERLEQEWDYHTAGRVYAIIGDKAGTFRCIEALDGIARMADRLAETYGKNGGAHLVPGFVETGKTHRARSRELLDILPL